MAIPEFGLKEVTTTTSTAGEICFFETTFDMIVATSPLSKIYEIYDYYLLRIQT